MASKALLCEGPVARTYGPAQATPNKFLSSRSFLQIEMAFLVMKRRYKALVVVAGCKCKLDKAAQDNTLVVGPGLQTVVLAVVGKSVVDQPILVDHATVLEPVPLLLGDLEVCAVVGDASCQRSSRHQVEFVGDSIHVTRTFFAFLLPPDATTFRSSAGLHVVEDVDGSLEVLRVSGSV
ncbi:hypothetical protein HG531_010457 [Fusarium graminearum]|nr:hypothetical protein HG531_010457 [Fusarium graminearum]